MADAKIEFMAYMERVDDLRTAIHKLEIAITRQEGVGVAVDKLSETVADLAKEVHDLQQWRIKVATWATASTAFGALFGQAISFLLGG